MTAKLLDIKTYESTPWGLVLFEGAMGVMFGAFFLAAGGWTMVMLVGFLGLYWLISGLISIGGIFIDKRKWGLKLGVGLLGVLAGLLIFSHPLWSALLVPTALAIIVGVFGIIMGLIKIVHAFTGAGWDEGLRGVVSLILGVLLVGSPYLAPKLIPTLLGAVLFLGGLVIVFMAFRVWRGAKEQTHHGHQKHR
jgi:uncharacterized membrane protein HdeD (DUF308 family)